MTTDELFEIILAFWAGACYLIGFRHGMLHIKVKPCKYNVAWLTDWIDVKESLPPVEREVIVLSDNIHGKTVKGANYISFGHRVDKRYAKDYDGWNIPGVHHWLPCPPVPGEDSARYSSNLCF